MVEFEISLHPRRSRRQYAHVYVDEEVSEEDNKEHESDGTRLVISWQVTSISLRVIFSISERFCSFQMIIRILL